MKKEIHGNRAGIRDAVLEQILQLYELAAPADTFLPQELCERMADLTELVGREILVYLSRAGAVEDVRIGDDRTVSMEELRLVRNQDRLCGVRCIHTHPNGSGMLSDVDMGSLATLKLDAMCAVGVRDGKATSVYAAFYGGGEDGAHTVIGPMRAYRLPQKRLMEEIRAADLRLRSSTQSVTETRPDRAILVGIENTEGYDTLAELAELAKTAGLAVVSIERQRRRPVDNATYVGSGKAEELALLGNAREADVFVFDDELSAVQLRNLEDALGLPIVDRTMLILGIFAARATSREGKLQVELAQLKYRLPRLMGMGKVLSRQGGSGALMRGPGEKKLEIDRRRIRRRVFELEQELSEIEKQRGLRRARRDRNPIPLVSLVGYTNAGKSTLLNALSGSDVPAEDKLFATLDPVVRRIALPSGGDYLLSDTVGFINKLPHELVQAFKSTLEEVKNADLILHVIDSACPYFDVQMRVVEDVLGELGALDTPRLDVYNKIDCEGAQPLCRGSYAHISAVRGDGLDALGETIEKMLSGRQLRVELTIPYTRYDAMQAVREAGTVLSETHEADGTHVVALLDEQKLWMIRQKLEV